LASFGQQDRLLKFAQDVLWDFEIISARLESSLQVLAQLEPQVPSVHEERTSRLP